MTWLLAAKIAVVIVGIVVVAVLIGGSRKQYTPGEREEKERMSQ